LWKGLAIIHPRQKSAYVAGWWQTAMIVIAIIVSAALRADPMRSVAPCMGIIASVGVAAVQLLTSVAVFFFFHREGHRISPWRSVAAPALSAVGLCYLIYQMVVHVELLVGFDAVWVKTLPWIIPVTGVMGVSFAYFLKLTRPSVYDRLGRILREA
jgi:hypothetical protein